MPNELFRLPFAAPIPVGHVVELTYFDGPEATDFDRPEPLVVDRTTGIAYTCDWHHKEMLGARPTAPIWRELQRATPFNPSGQLSATGDGGRAEQRLSGAPTGAGNDPIVRCKP